MKQDVSDCTSISIRRNIKYIIPLVLASLIPRLVYYFLYLNSEGGLPKSPDGVWYLEHAYALWNKPEVAPDIVEVFYIGYYGVLSLILFIFRSVEFAVLLQVILNALNVIVVYKICVILFNSRTAMLAGLIYAAAWPVFHWSVFILTDSPYVTFLLLAAYFMLKLQYGIGRQGINLLFLTLCSLYMVLLRPAGTITLMFIAVYALMNLDYRQIWKFAVRYRYFVLPSLAVIAVGVVLFSRTRFLSSLMASAYWNMVTLLDTIYKRGQIFDIVTKYDHQYNAVVTNKYLDNYIIGFFLNNWKDILALYLKRAVTFFGIWIYEFDITDIKSVLIYAVKLTPFAAGLNGIIQMFRKGGVRKSSLLLFIVVSVWAFCVFFFIDSAFRYTVPALPFMGMLAAYGIDRYMEAADGICGKLVGAGRQK